MSTFLRCASALLFALTVAPPCSASEPASLHFSTAAWPAAIDGTPEAGAPLRIVYDAARLPACRQLNRNTAWEIAMHYRFDDGPIATLIVADPGMALSRDRIDVPAGARTLTLWFENFAAANGGRDIVCQTWDSANGQNYTFALQ